jgi:hypothetical protein
MLSSDYLMLNARRACLEARATDMQPFALTLSDSFTSSEGAAERLSRSTYRADPAIVASFTRSFAGMTG